MKPTYEELETRLANAESKCRDLAAESDALKFYLRNGPVIRKDSELAAAHQFAPETPATDAFLAEVRASAITDALKSLDVVFDTDCVMESNGISYEDAEQRTAGAYAVSKALEEFAAQLRKGAAL